MNNSQSPTPAELNPLIALYNARRYAELEGQASKMVKRYPASGFAWKLLGAAQQMQGKNALEAFSKTAKLLSKEPDAHFNLGVAQNSLGMLDKAASSYRRAISLNPKFAGAHFKLAAILKDLGNTQEAISAYQSGLALKPDVAEAHFHLGNLFHNLGQFPQAVNSFRHLLRLKPDTPASHRYLGNALRHAGEFDSAAASYRKSLELEPDSADAYSQLGHVLKDQEQLSAAKEHYLRALDIDINCVEALLGLGVLYSNEGDTAKAISYFHDILKVEPDNLITRYLLAYIAKVRADDDNFTALQTLEEKALNSDTPLPNNQAVILYFALGKCLSDLGEHDLAFSKYQKACQAKRETFEYSATEMSQLFNETIRVFDKTIIERLSASGNPSRRPIFVLGMPRSGTTLTEQIIASHPEVHGAGELPDMASISRRKIGTASFPGNILALEDETLSQWADEYLKILDRYATDVQHITDKMPYNFWLVGLIHSMFPNAKIIHVQRHPADNCLSCFTTMFGENSQLHTYDLAELGRYYVDYVRLMEHWRSVLPPDTMLEVRYEDIVADQDAQSRRIIDFLGLKWDDACIDFHKLERSVNTASLAQVRSPIYKSSVEKWRRHETHLQPLLNELGDLVPDKVEQTP